MQSKLRIAAAVAACIVAPSTVQSAWASPEDPYGSDWIAIAISPENRNGGYGGGGMPEEAIRIAMDECVIRSNGNRCVFVTAQQYGCVAFGIDHRTNSWAGGRGPTEEAALQEVALTLPPDFDPQQVSSGTACSHPQFPPS